MSWIRIEEPSPQSETGEGGRFDFVVLRQCLAPDLPEGRRANHLLTILLNPMLPFFKNTRSPTLSGLSIWKGGHVDCGGPQHIQIMNLSQIILQLLEIIDPGIVQRRQKILNDVAEFLDCNAEPMPGSIAGTAQNPPMQFMGFVPAFQGHVKEHRAA